MKAVTYHQFGSVDVLNYEEVALPALPEDGVLVSQRASSINVVDYRARSGLLAPFVNKKFPKIPGADVAGVVTAVGSKVRGFSVGDAVLGATDPFKGGALAETVAVLAKNLVHLPSKISFTQAAALPIAAVAALESVRDLGGVKAGRNVLIYGASGAVGLYAVQLAKHFGAHVTAVSGAAGVEVLTKLGADVVIDYRKGPIKFARNFDVVIDYSSQFPFNTARAILTAAGRYVDASPNIPKFILSMIGNLFRRQKNLMLATATKAADLETIIDLVQKNVLTITVAKHFPLDQAKQAFTEMERGGTVGKIMVQVG